MVFTKFTSNHIALENAGLNTPLWNNFSFPARSVVHNAIKMKAKTELYFSSNHHVPLLQLALQLKGPHNFPVQVDSPASSVTLDNDPSQERKSHLKQQNALLNTVNNTRPEQCSSLGSSVSGSVPITQQFENMSLQNPNDMGRATMFSYCVSVPAQSTGPIQPQSHQSSVNVPGDIKQHASMASVGQVGGVHYHGECTSAFVSVASGELLSGPPNVRPGDQSMSGLSSVGGTHTHEQETPVDPEGK